MPLLGMGFGEGERDLGGVASDLGAGESATLGRLEGFSGGEVKPAESASSKATGLLRF